jgi:MraZ protein
VFTGEYRHGLDEKGRLAVPARFRGELQDGAFVSKWLDLCLAIFPKHAWDDVATKVATLNLSDSAARAFQRYLFASAFEVELDRQGRVVIPSGLREFAGLAGDVAVIGSRDHVELWEPGRWMTYSSAMDSPDVLAQHLQGLGI